MIRPALHRSGTVSLATTFVLLLFLLLVVVLLNATRVTVRKLEVQNAADAGGHAAGVQFARSLNTVTSVNHLIGEWMAVSVLAYTPGGIELEGAVAEGKTGRVTLTAEQRAELTEAYTSAARAGAAPDLPTYQRMADLRGDSGAAIGAARLELVRAFTASCRRLVAAPASPEEREVQTAITAEWELLHRLEDVARTKLLPLKWACNHTLVPDLANHARRVVVESPDRAATAVAGLPSPPDTRTFLRPHALPVEPERDRVAANGWERSQMVRATTPWVQFWRQPVLAFARKHLPLSRYADHYREWSQHFTLEMARWQAEDYGTSLYVVRAGTGEPAEKGREAWTRRDGSRLADELFGLLAVSRSPSPPVVGRPVFRQPRPNGVLATAQVMLYNANPQTGQTETPAALDPRDWQPVVGWDTLNWDPDVRVPEHRFGLRADTDKLVRRPGVRPNWRVKLTPVTLLEGASDSPEAVRDAARGFDAAPWLHNTR